ncbi:MAG: hypothetical protein RL172_3268 [Bacteroidota bacterium]|jgi:hypothetical protein
MGIESIKQSLKGSLDTVSEQLKDSLALVKNLKEASTEKLNQLVNDILGIAPLIEETGFTMKDVSVDIGIPLGISLSFVKEKDIDPQTIEKMLEENKDKEVLKLIVTALQKADTLQKSMNLSNYTFKGLGMKLGFPPDVSLKFERN